MANLTELMESALDSLPDGIALIGVDGEVVFWNQAAEEITGWAAMEILNRSLPSDLEVLAAGWQPEDQQPGWSTNEGHSLLVSIRHKRGHELRAMTRPIVLRDALGKRTGTAVVFSPAAEIEALPLGQAGSEKAIKQSQAEFEEILRAGFEDFRRGGGCFGVLWVTVDQAQELRKTHGAQACEAMMSKARMALNHGLRPGDEIGRWGENEYLIMAHERTPETLDAHGRALAIVARTADFHWWGDKVPVTVSIGAAQAEKDETLAQLLERARAVAASGSHAGGGTAASAAREQA